MQRARSRPPELHFGSCCSLLVCRSRHLVVGLSRRPHRASALPNSSFSGLAWCLPTTGASLASEAFCLAMCGIGIAWKPMSGLRFWQSCFPANPGAPSCWDWHAHSPGPSRLLAVGSWALPWLVLLLGPQRGAPSPSRPTRGMARGFCHTVDLPLCLQQTAGHPTLEARPQL